MKATNPAAERRSLCPGNKKLSIRKRIGCCGYRHVQTAVIAVFFCFLGMQFNSIQFFLNTAIYTLMQTLREMPPTEFTTKAIRRDSAFWMFAVKIQLMFFNAII